jgi:hypothetical protein
MLHSGSWNRNSNWRESTPDPKCLIVKLTALPSPREILSDASRALSGVAGSKTCRQHKSTAFL